MTVNGLPSNGKNLPEGVRGLENRGPENDPRAEMVERLGLESLGNQTTHEMPHERPSLSDDQNSQLPKEKKVSLYGRITASLGVAAQKCNELYVKIRAAFSRFKSYASTNSSRTREGSSQSHTTAFLQENRNYLKETQSSGFFEKMKGLEAANRQGSTESLSETSPPKVDSPVKKDTDIESSHSVEKVRRKVAVKPYGGLVASADPAEVYKTLKEQVIANQRMTPADQHGLQTFIRGLGDQERKDEIFEIAQSVPVAVRLLESSSWNKEDSLKALRAGEKALPFIPKNFLQDKVVQKKLVEIYPSHILPMLGAENAVYILTAKREDKLLSLEEKAILKEAISQLKDQDKEKAILEIGKFDPELAKRLKDSSSDVSAPKATVGSNGVTFHLSEADEAKIKDIFEKAESKPLELKKMPETYWSKDKAKEAVELHQDAIRNIPRRWKTDPDVQRAARTKYPKLTGPIDLFNAGGPLHYL